jgi:hypothetical protein
MACRPNVLRLAIARPPARLPGPAPLQAAAVAVDHPVLGGAVLLGGEQAGPACGLAASEQEDVGFLADLPDAELGIDCGQVGDQPVRMGLRAAGSGSTGPRWTSERPRAGRRGVTGSSSSKRR